MGKTAIEWCDYTWNPWRGCTEVSEGCDNCYAREFAKRNPKVLGTWGEGEPRVVAGDGYLRNPVSWRSEATNQNKRKRVFLGSMMDYFDLSGKAELDHVRLSASVIINGTCDWLDWMILTKRPQNINSSNPDGFYTKMIEQYSVWYGVSVENQKWADIRIPLMEKHYNDINVFFLSVEPLLEEVDLGKYLSKDGPVDWVIVGGESSQPSGVRRCDIEWIESIVCQCDNVGVPVFVKQLGSFVTAGDITSRLRLAQKAGKDDDEWPDQLRRREFPRYKGNPFRRRPC